VIRRAALGVLLVLATRGLAAQASTELRFEAGYANVRQPGFDARDAVPAVDAALFAVYWRRPTDRWTLYSSANLTYARDSLAAAQGVAAFSFPWLDKEHLRTDVGLAGATFSLRSTGRGGNGNGFMRNHYVRDQWGAWLGGAGGITARDGRRRRSIAGDLGLWTRWRFLYASASVARQNSDDFTLLFASGGTATPLAPSYEVEDWQLVMQARRGPHDLTASWTDRHAVAGSSLAVTAFSLAGTLQINETVAFLTSAGRQVADPVRGLPQADIITASIRVSIGPQPLPVMERATIADAEYLPRTGGGGTLVVRIEAHDSLAVEVAGDFSEWKPLPLVREGSYWVARVPLPPGKYHVGVRANLGIWRAPRNLARVRDDFGGESGLIVIP
jgi:hypothetical protein